MFCPYCAAPMVPAPHGELRCSATGALFSRHLQGRFANLASEAGLSESANEILSARLHCPQCGTEMDKMRCVDCGARLTKNLVREIIELNPHVG